MTGFVIRRLVRSLATLWLVVSLVFVALRLTGDPAAAMLPDDASPQQLAAFRARYGLDEALPVQYWRYWESLARGDFGDSLNERRPVLDLISQRLAPTLQLAGAAIAIGLLLGIPAGLLAAVRRNSAWDRLLMGLAFVGQSAPNFFIGIVLILIFSLQFKLLPSSGRDSPQALILPALTLATGLLAAMARMTRSALLEVVGQDYIRVARAKGLAERRVILGHALRNAAIPVVTVFGLAVGVMIGGAAVTETVFAWPGIGRLAVASISIRDYPVIQCIVLLIATSVVAVNLVVDLAYGWLDPRIRQSAGGR